MSWDHWRSFYSVRPAGLGRMWSGSGRALCDPCAVQRLSSFGNMDPAK